jgi:transcriptional regulator with XRE-family HTH domain
VTATQSGRGGATVGQQSRTGGASTSVDVWAAVGNRLKLHRVHAGISARELAERAGVAYSLVTAIERGKKRLTDAVLQRLAKQLKLTPGEMDRLRGKQAGSDENFSDIPGFYVSADRLMEMECQSRVASVWVLDPSPLEMLDAGWLGKVVENLTHGKQYVYFVPSSRIAEDLRAMLMRGAADRTVIDQRVRFVTVPVAIEVFFFNPRKLFWFTDTGQRIGIWAFRGRADTWVDGGITMDVTSVSELVGTLENILLNLEDKQVYQLLLNSRFEISRASATAREPPGSQPLSG